jgi:hypothetical protein
MSWRRALARRVAALAPSDGAVQAQRLLPPSSVPGARHYRRLPHASQIRSKVHSPLSPPESLGALLPRGLWMRHGCRSAAVAMCLRFCRRVTDITVLLTSLTTLVVTF